MVFAISQEQSKLNLKHEVSVDNSTEVTKSKLQVFEDETKKRSYELPQTHPALSPKNVFTKGSTLIGGVKCLELNGYRVEAEIVAKKLINKFGCWPSAQEHVSLLEGKAYWDKTRSKVTRFNKRRVESIRAEMVAFAKLEVIWEDLIQSFVQPHSQN
ncbi:hypothetical protein D1115_10795 [Vibrio alfacsensis]|uniref:Uncharacterized protein n=1 Tax=Vibrio alfacsensis TaxID=1074311 RepID=A0ABN5PE79_9VIBR|nr:hypothetical protein [Vibrio alfacsensis]AXY01565.1 hypothetical protein D1115_10795 [Vibrio alfacsensis]